MVTERDYLRLVKERNRLKELLATVKQPIEWALEKQPPAPRLAGEPPGGVEIVWFTGRDNAEAILRVLRARRALGKGEK